MREATTTPEQAASTAAISRATFATETGYAGSSVPARIAAATATSFLPAETAQTAAAPEGAGHWAG